MFNHSEDERKIEDTVAVYMYTYLNTQHKCLTTTILKSLTGRANDGSGLIANYREFRINDHLPWKNLHYRRPNARLYPPLRSKRETFTFS